MTDVILPEVRYERVTGKPEVMPDCGTNFRLADNPPGTHSRNTFGWSTHLRLLPDCLLVNRIGV